MGDAHTGGDHRADDVLSEWVCQRCGGVIEGRRTAAWWHRNIGDAQRCLDLWGVEVFGPRNDGTMP